METIQKSQLLEILVNIPNGQLGTLTTEKETRMLKRGNPYLQDLVIERRRQTVLFNFSYANAVNNRREKAGLPRDFTPAPRAWGTHIKKHIVEHKGNLYLDAQLLSRDKAVYTVNGVETPKDVLAPFLPKRKPSELANLTAKDLAGMSQQDLEKWSCENVQFRDYNLATIVQLNAAGKSYEVV
jgi:hypothetical protein